MSTIGLSYSEVIGIIGIVIASVVALYIFYNQIVYQNHLNDLKSIHSECSLIVNQINEIVKNQGVNAAIFQFNQEVRDLWVQVGIMHDNSIDRSSYLLNTFSPFNLKKSFVSSYVLDRHLLEQRIVNILGIKNFIILDERYNKKKIIEAINAKNIAAKIISHRR